MILSPTSTRRTSARSSSYQSLSPRSPCRSDSMASGLSAQTAPTTHAGTSSRRHKSTASGASDATGGMDGGGDNEGGEAGGGSPRISSGRAADASSGADVSTAPSSQGRYFFGATGELVRALTSSASSATSATSGVSPPPDATASGRPNSRTPPSVLPGAPSSSARLGNTRSGGRGRGRGGNGGEGVVRTGELPSLLAPVDLHARDGDAVGHQVRFFVFFIKAWAKNSVEKFVFVVEGRERRECVIIRASLYCFCHFRCLYLFGRGVVMSVRCRVGKGKMYSMSAVSP